MNDTTNAIMKLIDMLPEPMRAAILASAIALVRVVYDGREPKWVRRIMEAILMGLLALAVSSITQALGLAEGWATFIGGAMGLFGVDKVREWGQRFAEKKVQ